MYSCAGYNNRSTTSQDCGQDGSGGERSTWKANVTKAEISRPRDIDDVGRKGQEVVEEDTQTDLRRGGCKESLSGRRNVQIFSTDKEFCFITVKKT